MKRAFGLGLGVAMAAMSAAGETGPTPARPLSSSAVSGPAQPTVLPPGLKYKIAPESVTTPTVKTVAAVETLPDVPAKPLPRTTGITAAAADLPMTPTVPAPNAPATVATADATLVAQAGPTVVEGGPVPDSGPGCTNCGGSGGHGGVHGAGRKVYNWLMFRPGPAVLPRFVPTPYTPPLMSYFPNGPVPLRPAPAGGPTVTADDEKVPPVATPTPKDKDADKNKDKNADKDTQTRKAVIPNRTSLRTDPVPALMKLVARGATPDIQQVEARTTTDAGIVRAGGPVAEEAPVAVAPVAPPVVVAPPAVAAVPEAVVVAPAGVPPAAFDSMILVGQAQVFKKCEHHACHIPCTGHGDLSGYRFAIPVVHPCPPLKPLFVRDCLGGSCGGGIGGVGCPSCAAAAAGGVQPPALPPVAAKTAPKPSADQTVATDVSRPFTNP